jgi:hypothetical protein
MAKPDPKKEPELLPDAWARFERFIRDIAKAGPQHRTKTKTKSVAESGKKDSTRANKKGGRRPSKHG